MTKAGSDTFNILDAPAYSVAEVSRLVNMKPWTVRRYLRGYEYDYGYTGGAHRTKQPPVVKSNKKYQEPYASFLDLIDLLFVRELLKRGYGLPTIRRALDEVRERLGTPHFGQSVFFANGSENILWKPSKKYHDVIALQTNGQMAIPEIVEFLYNKLDFEKVTDHGFVNRYFPKGIQDYIVIDPEIAFGRPVLKNSGIPTHNIYDLYLGERKKIGPVSDWFKIPAPEIEAAVSFERSLWG